MKKFACIIALILVAIPMLCFAGCKNKDTAEAIVNRTYYVTKVVKDGQNISSTATKKHMRIVFMEDNFKIELGDAVDASSYGYYYGTYKIKENNITLKTTKYGGILYNATTDKSKGDFVLRELRFKNGKLFTEFINNHCILQYTLELKNK